MSWFAPITILGTSPAARACHTLTEFGDRTSHFLLFGGEDGKRGLFNNAFVLDYSTQLEWKNVATNGTPPCSRCLHTMTSNQDKMLLFGGFDGKKPLDDLYSLDLRTSQWSKITPEGDHPRPTYGHTSVIIGKRVYYFGGRDEKTFLNKIYAFDPGSGKWSEVDCGAGIPPPRSGHTATVLGQNMFIFGGARGKEHFNDVWRYDTRTNSWEQCSNAGEAPSPRFSHSTTPYEKHLVVFGGATTNDKKLEHNAIHLYDTENRMWKKFIPKGSLGYENKDLTNRIQHTATTNDVGSKIYIFGGRKQESKKKFWNQR